MMGGQCQEEASLGGNTAVYKAFSPTAATARQHEPAGLNGLVDEDRQWDGGAEGQNSCPNPAPVLCQAYVLLVLPQPLRLNQGSPPQHDGSLDQMILCCAT